MFSKRTPADLTPNRFSSLLESRRRSGARLLDLTDTNPTRAGLADSAHLIPLLAAEEASTYAPSPRGLRPAREAVASWLAAQGAQADPERIWLTAGTSEAYSFLFKLLGDPGDEILVPTPSYPLLDALLRLDGLVPKPYGLHFGGNRWLLDPDGLRRAAGPRARAVVAVHPNNPTGSLLSREEQGALLRTAEERGLAVISDEVFFPFRLDPKNSSASFSAARFRGTLFVLGGISKLFGLPQMKLAWIHAHGTHAGECAPRLDWIADAYLSVGAPVQAALPRIFEKGRPVTEAIRERIRASDRVLRESCSRGSSLTYLVPEGGWSGILALPDGTDEGRLAEELLDRHGLAVQPGYFFDLPFPAALVVSLLTPPGDLAEGLEVICGALGPAHGAARS